MVKEFVDILYILEQIKNNKNRKVLSYKQISNGYKKLKAFKRGVEELRNTVQEAQRMDLTGIETAGRTLANLYTHLVDIVCYTQDIQEIVVKTMRQYDFYLTKAKKEL